MHTAAAKRLATAIELEARAYNYLLRQEHSGTYENYMKARNDYRIAQRERFAAAKALEQIAAIEKPRLVREGRWHEE